MLLPIPDIIFEDWQSVQTAIEQIRFQLSTDADPTFAGLLTTDKIKFTQTDGNEYIDSLADGYLDYSATTAHRLRMSTADTDVRLEFIGTTNSGLIEWLEDEDCFKVHDDIMTDRWLNSATNTFLGINVVGSGNLDTGGLYNTAIGNTALEDITTGVGNTAVGWHAVGSITTNNANTGIGFEALGGNTGAGNTALGAYAGITGDGSNCVFIGNNAGRFETGSNKLFIDGILRTNEADARVKALIYGVFAAATADQELHFNATVETLELLTLSGGLVTTETIDASAGEVLVEDNATAEPTGKSDGYVGVAKIGGQGRIYFEVEGTMYYCTADAAAVSPTTGNPIGLLLLFTYV